MYGEAVRPKLATYIIVDVDAPLVNGGAYLRVLLGWPEVKSRKRIPIRRRLVNVISQR